MLIKLSQKLPLEYNLLPEQKSQLIDARVFQNIQINIFHLLLIKILLNHIQYFLIFQRLFTDIQNFNVLS